MIPIARPDLGQREIDAVLRVLRSGSLTQGPEVLAFEDEFSRYAVNGRSCVAVNSGTSALHLAMLALGLGHGDEVVVPSFTFAATANSVAMTGAKPIFVDIDPNTFTLSADAVQSVLTPKTRAVVAVHLYGHPADLSRLETLCRRNGLWLVEDAAQAHLASWDGRPVGAWGTVAAFSFYPTKNMTSGEGGMIVTDDGTIFRAARLLRNQGQEKRYQNEVVGLNNRMSDIHAAIGRIQLESLGERTNQRRVNAAFFDSNLTGVELPRVHESAMHVYHQYTIRVVGHDRERFAEELAQRGVGSGIYYPTPVHRLPAFASPLNLVETDRASQEVLSIPVHPSLTRDELEQIVTAVNEVANAGA